MANIKLYNKISQVGLDVFDSEKYTVSETVEAPEGILVRSAALHDEPFGKELLAIARAGAGVNNIPIDRCSENGIVVFNTPGANANGVKELALAALFLASRDIVGGINWALGLKGTPDVAKQVEKGKSKFVGPEIKGKTLGVIGLGAIGGMVANTASDIKMKVIGCDPYITVKNAWSISRAVRKADDYDAIYAEADYISYHIPSLPTTKGIINKENIAKMKDGVRIINLSRGDLANIPDLIEALESGKYRYLRVNFPNGDMVGHTGSFAATKCSMEALDLQLGRILPVIDKLGGVAVITADHGNADEMCELDKKTGEPKLDKNGKAKAKTSHTLRPVPCIVYDNVTKDAYKLKEGSFGLSNVAATMVNLLGYEAPEMWDESILEF